MKCQIQPRTTCQRSGPLAFDSLVKITELDGMGPFPALVAKLFRPWCTNQC